MAYTPTDRDRWNAQQRAIAEQRRRIEADRKEAARIRAQSAKDELAHRKNISKMQQDAVDQIEKEAEDEEKALLTKPAIKRTGGTGNSTEPLIVWHHRAEPPADMTVKQRRKGLGAILILPKGGGYSSADAAITWLRAKNPGLDVEHPEFVAAHKTALAEMWGCSIIAKLADDKAMGKIFYAAGVTSDTSRKETVTGEYGVYEKPVTRRHVPELKEVIIRASGLELIYRHHLGDSAAQWNKGDKKEALRAAFRSLGVDAGNMEISDTKTGDVRIAFNDRDPFDSLKGMTTGTWDDEKCRSLLGIDHHGREVWINWKDASGMVVGGVIGSGKTASMLPVFAGMKDNCELFVFDGKAQRDLDSLQHIARVYDNSGDIDAPLATLEMLERLRKLRGDAIFKKWKAANFWHLTSAQRREADMFPIFVLLDEAQLWLKLSTNKERAKIQAQISELVWTLITKGRSAGIVLILTTQRPSAETISTDIRDNVKLKLCFKVTTPIMGEMILGSQPKGMLDPSAIPVSAQGRFVMDTDGQGMVLGQAGYISPGDLEDALKNSEPVADQWEVAEAFAGGERGARKPDQPGEVVKTDVQTGPKGGVETATPEPTPEPLTDDALLRALAEAQRRGMLKQSESRAPAADVIGEV